MNQNFLQERYQRQIILKGFGETAQHTLLQAKVLVVGAGGLGSPVLQYLTAAGVGKIGIVDGDVVSVSNLHRQVLFDESDIGKYKVAIALNKLKLMNGAIDIEVYPYYLDKKNCLEIISSYDVVVDCTDNFSSRYMINDACVLKQKPLVFAAVSGFEGQVAVFNFSIDQKNISGNYRDLFPIQPKDGEVLNCAEAGVLGILPGIIGSMQASEAIKIIAGIGKPLINQLLTFNALNNQTTIFEYNQNAHSAIVKTEADFYSMNYDASCETVNNPFEMDVVAFDKMVLQKATIIDVRELYELPVANEFEHIKIPLAHLTNSLNKLPEGKIIFFCQSGIRSMQAATIAAEYFTDNKRFFSLQGGILAWKKMHQNQLL
jgi:sulfur-carrier protein adenylyltransferase/sulfurtransferase